MRLPIRSGWCPVTLLVFCAISSASTATTRPNEFKYEFGKDHRIYLAVNWQQTKGWFVLDTGSKRSCVDSTAFPKLALLNDTDPMQSLNGDIGSELYEPPDLEVGPIHLRNSPAVWNVDLSEVSAASGRHILGILGMDFISNFVLQIDFDQQRFQFLANDTKRTLHDDWGEPFRMVIGGEGLPMIYANIAGNGLALTLDTGLDADLDLPSAQFDRILALTHGKTIFGRMATAAGDMRIREMRLPDFKLVDLQYTGLLLTENRSFFCIAGMGFLARHLVTFDFLNDTLYLKPSQGFRRQSEAGMSGLHLLAKGEDILVASVDTDSPAFSAGMRDGDLLISVNDKHVSRDDLDELWSLLKSRDGLKITVAYRQANQTKTATFTLRRQI
jgi:hypothetical protein